MRKTIRWTAAALAFLALGLVLFGVTENILRKKVGAESDMIHSFYELDRDSIDVLCIGSSHGYSAICPNTLWGEYGIPSYVMCSPKQTVTSSYYLLKEALNYQKPKIVLLETYYFRYEKKYADRASLREAFDGIRLGRVKVEMVNDVLRKASWKKKLSFYFPFLMYHSRWDDLTSEDFYVTGRYLKGGILGFKQMESRDPGLPDEKVELPPKTRKYLKKILELCEENGIRLVFFAAPFSYDVDYLNKKSYNKIQGTNLAVEEYAAQRGIPFFFYQKTREAGIDFQTDFRDKTHLNTYGAMKISRHLGGWMAQECGLTDHRGEEAYASWDRDYAHFLKEAESLQKTVEK